MNLVDELHAIAAALRDQGIPYAVCGGVAVTIHGATRSTKDIDLLVHRDDVHRILEAVRPLGYAYAALPMTFDEGTEKERHVQRVSLDSLKRMKRLAGRTQDLADLEHLEAEDA